MGLKKVKSSVDFVSQEHEVLDFWDKNKIFQKRRDLNKGGPKWSFIDGPITANNPMGVHHAWGRTLKDIFNTFEAAKLNKSINEQKFKKSIFNDLFETSSLIEDIGYKPIKTFNNFSLEFFQ